MPDEIHVKHNFGWALCKLREGARLTRSGWNGKGMFIYLKGTHGTGYCDPPYIDFFTAYGDRVPWTATQTDLLATDWDIA